MVDDITESMINKILVARNSLIDVLRLGGRVSWENMNLHNIPVDPTSNNRDDLICQK